MQDYSGPAKPQSDPGAYYSWTMAVRSLKIMQKFMQADSLVGIVCFDVLNTHIIAQAQEIFFATCACACIEGGIGIESQKMKGGSDSIMGWKCILHPKYEHISDLLSSDEVLLLEMLAG